MRDAALTFISQVSHRDLVMYLIAIKSIYRYFNAGQIVVLDDGSLTDRDRATLNHHLPSVRVFSCAMIRSANVPKGGCWERLWLISELVSRDFVIQVDSDSLTLNEICEVQRLVADNCSFTLLGAGSVPAVELMSEACRRAQVSGKLSNEPQGISERSLDQFPGFDKRRYVRGNAAFAGFARNSFESKDVEYFSKNMESICGRSKWHEWGSEQVTSNLIIANSPKADVLPFPKYTSFYAIESMDYARSSFVHFMGGHRFQDGIYSDLAGQAIRNIWQGSVESRLSKEPRLIEKPMTAESFVHAQNQIEGHKPKL
jgi:hypothetical protein